MFIDFEVIGDDGNFTVAVDGVKQNVPIDYMEVLKKFPLPSYRLDAITEEMLNEDA